MSGLTCSIRTWFVSKNSSVKSTSVHTLLAFQGFYLVLLVIGMVTIAGNTFFPSFLRLMIWILSILVPTHSRLHHDLQFLLQHPRRCFILLFPAINTWTLTILQGGINLGLWVLFIILQIDYPAVSSIPAGNRVIDGLFQAPGVRTSGYSIIGMSEIAPALLVVYTGAMYISGLPIIVSVRSSNVYEEKSLGIDAPEIQDDENEPERKFIGVSIIPVLLCRRVSADMCRPTYKDNSRQTAGGSASPSSSSASWSAHHSQHQPRATACTASCSRSSPLSVPSA